MPEKSDMKKDILNAAIKEFAEKGFDQTTMADIAKEAGIAVGSIYNYSENKVTLFENCAAHLLEEFSSFLEPSLIEEEDRIYALILRTFDYLKADLARAKIILIESFNFMINNPHSPIFHAIIDFEERLKGTLRDEIPESKTYNREIQLSILLGGVERLIKELIFFPGKSAFDKKEAAREIAAVLLAHTKCKEIN